MSCLDRCNFSIIFHEICPSLHKKAPGKLVYDFKIFSMMIQFADSVDRDRPLMSPMSIIDVHDVGDVNGDSVVSTMNFDQDS